MALGKGGQSDSQRSDYSANNNQTTTQNQNQTTNQNQTGSYSSNVNNTSTINPLAPNGWESAWRGMQPGNGGLNSTGFNNPQQTGVDWFGANLGTDSAGLGSVRDNLNSAGDWQKDQVDNRQLWTLNNLANAYPEAYGVPQDVQAQKVAAQQIAAKQGAEFIDSYKNPYLSQVLDSSLTDYDTGVSRAANAFRAQSLAGGSTGGAYGSNPVGAAILAGEAARGRGALSSGIRSDAFNTAAGFGMQDANRVLGADQANQNANLMASQINAANDLAAQQFNANMLDSRSKFDANLGLQGNQVRDQLMRDYVNTQTQGANVGISGANIDNGYAGGLINAGTTGNAQNIDWANQGLSWLGAATPLFGQQQNTTGTESGNSTGSSSGSSSMDTTGTTTGNVSGNSYGSSKGKSGGLSLF